ncbi:BAR/IMD domain-containing adapter protein 2 isoform X2 [Periplaneta americana]|uniref:BAR/IMD domain-containing adapter protein 2 isoform X2 n=1 Tax=Periplaneta americana TaxID=6978 RepID=UPI0037E71642
METEEITKLVDGIYKNILDKFNPGARQLINAGKAYLKALHGAAAASRLYVEAINKLARQAQQGTWGGSSDIGSALLQIVEVYKEIQAQQMNILKAFYVDLLVPLETNLEKDTKVVQSEQKRFLQQHKQRSETYSKAAATMKKQRKKNKGTTKTGLAMDKELKNMQVLEEEKSKLDAFCEQSLKTAMTQERRRYGFVLERQCSLAKHYLAYHNQGSTVLQRHLDDWQEVAQTREFLPDSVEVMFTNRLRQVSFWPDEDLYSSPRSPNVEDDRLSIASQLRKTKSMDASCLDMRSINDATSPMKPLSRAKSDFNLTASTHSLVQDPDTPTRPKSMAVPDRGPGWDTQLARALYAYLSSGDNQLSFLEGDIIALMGERNKGWQFGENLRTQCSGWFPLAYTELILDDASSPTHQRMQSLDSTGSSTAATTPATPTAGGFGITSPSAAGVSGLGQQSQQQQQPSSLLSGKSGVPSPDTAAATSPRPSAAATPVTMFGDTLLYHRATAAAKQIRRGTTISASNVGPPPTLPAPVPTPKVPASSTLPVARGVTERRLIHPPPMPPLPMLGNVKRPPGAIGSGIGNASLHSSNDSGFSNDPPPAPEVDYSDDDSTRANVFATVKLRKTKTNDRSAPLIS